MRNGWTGGQYSLFRAILGVYLLIRFAALVPNVVAIIAVIAALFFIIGLFDRVAAAAMLGAFAYLFGWQLFVAFLLVAHVLLPEAPFWSWAARGRVDPRGKWAMPAWLFGAAWGVLFLGYAYLRKLDGSLALLHLFAFDPGWIPRRSKTTTDRVLYDGSCGLCHRSVRFLIAEDRSGTAFVYAPQEGGGATVIVETADGRTLIKTAAVIHLMHRLGGWWRVLAIVFALVPRPLRDLGYDFVARVRYRIFGKTKDACPLMPPDLRSRFTV